MLSSFEIALLVGLWMLGLLLDIVETCKLVALLIISGLTSIFFFSTPIGSADLVRSAEVSPAIRAIFSLSFARSRSSIMWSIDPSPLIIFDSFLLRNCGLAARAACSSSFRILDPTLSPRSESFSILLPSNALSADVDSCWELPNGRRAVLCSLSVFFYAEFLASSISANTSSKSLFLSELWWFCILTYSFL